MTNAGPPQPHQPPTSYIPYSHVMPLQVSTVPSVAPPPSHISLQAPIGSSSETKVTYLHVPPTHTVLADVHAPFTHASSDASANASLVSSQPQSTTVTAMHTQSVSHPAVNFNALPTGLTATADTVVPPPTAMPPPVPPTTIHSTPVPTASQSLYSLFPRLLLSSHKCRNHILGLRATSLSKTILSAFVE